MTLFESHFTQAFSVLVHGYLPAHANVQITEQWDYSGELVSCLTWHWTGWHSEFAHLWHLITRNPFGCPQNEREHLIWRCLSAAHWFRMYWSHTRIAVSTDRVICLVLTWQWLAIWYIHKTQLLINIIGRPYSFVYSFCFGWNFDVAFFKK